MTKSDHLLIVNTTSDNSVVILPQITDPVADIGLTVEIQQDDVDSSTHWCDISCHVMNPGYRIFAFGFILNTLTLNYDATGDFRPGPNLSGTPRRSVALTFIGIINEIGRWQLTGNMAC